MVDPAETKLKLLAALDADDKVVVLDIVADLERQIAELRAELAARKDAHFSIVRETANRAEALEAENARLRALPLKDEVERVLEPFVLVAEVDIGESESDEDLFRPISDGLHAHAPRLTVGHFRSALAAFSRLRAGEQEGWKLVPIEPTLAMRNAGWREIDKQGFQTEDTEVAPIYRAMILAAPSEQGGDRDANR